MAGARAPNSTKDFCAPRMHKCSTPGTTWAGTMGISVVTNVDKGLTKLALALSQVQEALPNSREGWKVSTMSGAGFPTSW